MKKIPPFKLIPEPLTEEAQQALGFKWAPEEFGTRHRIGGEPDFIQRQEIPMCSSCGEPDFIQRQEIPMCSSCGEPMTFYAQLDSIGDEYDIADGGMIYVFLCFDCFDATAIVDSY